MLALAGSFFLVALIYAIVGFGGGSSYTAMLSLFDTPYTLIPKLSLICNLLVVSGGCYQYWRKRHFDFKLMTPFLLSSVPCAFLGGAFPLKEKTFMILLTATLFVAGMRVILVKSHENEETHPPAMWLSVIVGAGLGLLSGMVGIGGGIFLSPIMLNFRWAKAKEVAAISSAFILLNSISGLIGQLTKGFDFPEFSKYIPLLIAVVVGGQIGSRVGTHQRVSPVFIQRCTGVLILFVSGRLFVKIVFQI